MNLLSNNVSKQMTEAYLIKKKFSLNNFIILNLCIKIKPFKRQAFNLDRSSGTLSLTNNIISPSYSQKIQPPGNACEQLETDSAQNKSTNLK